MDIKPIRSDADYKTALKETSALMETDPESGTEDGDRLDILSTLVEAYENRHFPMELPDPVEAIHVPHGPTGPQTQGSGTDDRSTQPRL